jgi:hypothetical protein
MDSVRFIGYPFAVWLDGRGAKSEWGLTPSELDIDWCEEYGAARKLEISASEIRTSRIGATFLLANYDYSN